MDRQVDSDVRQKLVEVLLAYRGTPYDQLFEYPHRADDSRRYIKNAESVLNTILLAVQDNSKVATTTPHDPKWWIEHANPNDWEDCEACAEYDDLCPVHHGIVAGQRHLSKAISAICEDNELLNYIPREAFLADRGK